MKLLGVVIANGFSSEARVFANLLRERQGRYEVLIAHHDQAVAHPKDAGAPEEFERAAQAPLLRFDSGWRRPPAKGHSKAAKLRAQLVLHRRLPGVLAAARRFRPDIVYSSQQRWDCYVASALAAALRVPHVVHLHYVVGPWLGAFSLWRLRHAAGVVCVSEFIRSQALAHGTPAARARAILNTQALGAEPTRTRAAVREELGLAADAPVVVFVSRLAEGKGHADALRAFASVLSEVPSARLLIVGDGELEASLKDEAERLALGDAVRFLGFRRDIAELLAASDFFLHPARQEPFGLVILEAAAHGLPTIAYDDGGPREIIRDGVSGRLVPPGDTAGLAQAIVRWIKDPGERERLGAAARADLSSRFAPAVGGERFASFLTERLAAQRG
jgi:glycosyltransferase involved in cell wall biosynthesis